MIFIINNLKFIKFIGEGKGTKDGQLNFPSNLFICSKSEKIFVANSYNKRIEIFNLNSGKFISNFGNNSQNENEKALIIKIILEREREKKKQNIRSSRGLCFFSLFLFYNI